MRTLAWSAAVVAATMILALPAAAESRTIDLPPFTSVDISSGIDAVVAVGGAQSVAAEAPTAEILDEVQFRVDNGTLKAWIDWNIFDLFSLGLDRQITLTISAPEITGAEASAGSDVDVAGAAGDRLSFEVSSGADLTATAVAGDSLNLEASSGAGLHIDGTCASADVEASSGAGIDAEKLLCADVEVDVSSGASAVIFASASVDAEASSGGHVVVYGKPTKFQTDSNSGGDVETAD
jgi:hypothetical protein